MEPKATTFRSFESRFRLVSLAACCSLDRLSSAPKGLCCRLPSYIFFQLGGHILLLIEVTVNNQKLQVLVNKVNMYQLELNRFILNAATKIEVDILDTRFQKVARNDRL